MVRGEVSDAGLADRKCHTERPLDGGHNEEFVDVVGAINEVYGQGGARRAGLAFFEPVFRGELGDGLVGVSGDLRQRVLEVVEGIDDEVPAGFNEGEEDGAALAAFGVADEDPVLFARGGGAGLCSTRTFRQGAMILTR